MYQPISRTDEAQSIRLYEIIIKRIKTMILAGELKVGDKLPSERELADMFQVSRVPVREALKILEFMELIQYIPGDGIYLKYIDINEFMSKIDFMIETSTYFILDLFEARQAIELKTIELAAIKRTDADLQVMDEIIAEMEQDINNGGDGVKAATNFHTAISKASKNKVLARINDLLINLTVISREKSLKRSGEASIALAQHKQMLNMIKNRNVAEAKKIMENHLEHNKQAALDDKDDIQ